MKLNESLYLVGKEIRWIWDLLREVNLLVCKEFVVEIVLKIR